jgi:hypothetical protein
MRSTRFLLRMRFLVKRLRLMLRFLVEWNDLDWSPHSAPPER